MHFYGFFRFFLQGLGISKTILTHSPAFCTLNLHQILKHLNLDSYYWKLFLYRFSQLVAAFCIILRQVDVHYLVGT